MKTIAYAENKSFYERLDRAVRDEVPVRITFRKNRLTEKAKLWPRLMKCKNSEVVKKEFAKCQVAKQSALTQILAPATMTACLTGGAIWLITFIATLISGIILYGIYKDRKVKFGLKFDLKGNPEGYIEIVPDEKKHTTMP